MVNDPFVTGPDFDGFQPARAVNRRAKNEIPVDIRASGGKRVLFFRFDNFVRLAQLPTGDKSWGGREVGCGALDSALLNPFVNEGDLFVGQAEFVGKFRGLRLWQPWRHEARRRYRSDLAGARLGVC